MVRDKLTKIGTPKFNGFVNSSLDDLERYDYLKIQCYKVNGKKRKKYAREMNEIKSKTKTFDNDYKQLRL